MTKKVLVSSFHSSVIDALRKQDYEPDLLLSFDSHLDVNMFGALKDTWDAVRAFNKNDNGLHFALTDPSIHMLARKWFPNTDIKIVIPSIALSGDVSDKLNKIQESTDLEDFTPGEVADYNEWWLERLNITLALSPPEDPNSFLDLVSRDTIIDLDADYFSNLQTECYISLCNFSEVNDVIDNKKFDVVDFGNMEGVLDLIRAARPDTICFSESRIACLNDPNSDTNYILKKLRTMGYEIEKHFLFNSDEEAISKLHLIRQLSEYIKKNRTSDEDLDKKIDQTYELAKQFFTRTK